MVIDNVVDFMTEVNDLLMYITGIPQERLFRGNQSREVLPRENDYIIYTPITQTRIGTNISTLYAEGVQPTQNAPETDQKLLQIDVQVDCYGSKAFAYAEGLETFAGSLKCINYLRQQGMAIRVFYASNPLDATLVDDTRQYVTRWVVTMSVAVPVSVTDTVPWVEDINVIVNSSSEPYDPEHPADPDDPEAPAYEKAGAHIKNVDVNFDVDLDIKE